ncbi:MAG TPA: LUD domain-containing protein [Pirellulales bacterium]|nr:LUD domain-containing protein [Pirellulales bacterium]
MAAKDETTRNDILRAVRAKKHEAIELPSLAQSWITYDDRRRQFAEVLQSVGGRAEFVDNPSQIGERLRQVAVFVDAKKIVSLVPNAIAGNVDLATIDDPHALEDVDFAILPAQFGVAENGAVWVTDEGIRHRAVTFIVQHLVLVLASGEILDNMHQAYERLRFPAAGYGAFISGPSKTADIEQSLVIGAHGPRSLTVFCVGGGGNA